MVVLHVLGLAFPAGWHAAAAVLLPLAQNGEAAEPLLTRLDPLTRTMLIMALLGVALLGIFLVAMIMLGGHWARRIARSRPRSSRSSGSGSEREDWRRILSAKLPDAGTTETILDEKPTDDTRTED